MNRLATATVSALGAIHAGFDGEEDAGVYGLLNLSCKEDETLEVIVRPKCVELVMCGLLAFGEDVEPEHGIHAMHLLICVAKRCRLKVTVSFAVRPLHRSGLPIANRLVSAVNGYEVKFTDQRFRESWHVHAERFGNRFYGVIVRPFGHGHIQHVASALIPEPVVFIGLVRQILADFGFSSEVNGEIFLRVLDGVAGAFAGKYITSTLCETYTSTSL